MRGTQTFDRRVIRLLTLSAAICAAPVATSLQAQQPGTIVAADKRVQGRTYVFQTTGKELPYALFVPSTYNAARTWPLIVGLHGLGRPYDWLMGYEGMIDFAERDGYILVTPLGYDARGWYGSRGPGTGQQTAPVQGRGQASALPPADLGELSEQDVMNVLGIVRRDFSVNPNRIYLWGHSMGGAGTYHLASKHPSLWAGLAVAAPAPSPSVGVSLAALETFKHIPILVLQGDDDRSVPVARTRQWVERMKQLGMEHVYIEVKGGDHTNFIAKDREMLSKVFSFFNIVGKTQQ